MGNKTAVGHGIPCPKVKFGIFSNSSLSFSNCLPKNRLMIFEGGKDG
jgi:hypothetical protein